MPALRDQVEGRRWLAVMAVLLLAAGTSGCAHRSVRERLEPVGRSIQDRVDAGRAASMAVAVARGERILWEEGFGWADREKQLPAGPHTMYPLASVSKPFTATGLMRLAERGRVALDDPANLYLGEAGLRVRVGNAREVTLRRLANHTAGLPLHHHFFPADGPYARPPAAVTIRRYANVVFPPGGGFQYSNLGYAVLEHLIERVSGQGFAEFMDREVLGPLRLDHTAVVLDPSRHPDIAARYRPDGSRLPFYDSDHRGASAFFACAHDLVRFGMFHLGVESEDQTRVLSSRARRLMRRPTSRRDGGGYGVGWRVSEHSSGHRLVQRGGDMPGASAVLTLVPEAKLVVAAVSNTSNHVARRVRDEVLEALLPMRRSGAGVARVARLARADEKRGRSSPPNWARGCWSGSVDTDVGGASFEGILAGQIVARDTRRRPHRLHLRVRRRGDRLQGAITAVSLPRAGLPMALSFWIDLRKEPPSRLQ